MIFGIDVGTTGCKSVLIFASGAIAASAYACYPTVNWEGAIGQDPSVWKDAVIKTVRECLKQAGNTEPVTAMALSFQSGTVIPLGADGAPLAPAILWLDNNAETETKELLEMYPQTYFYRKTGWRLSGSFNLLQILKIKKTHPRLFQDCRRFAHVADYLHEWLCGEPVVDLCGAGNSMLLNVPAADWDDELLDLCAIGRENLGDLAKTGAYLGTLRKKAAKELGLSDTVKVYCGAQDQFCSVIASKGTRSGDLIFSMGTSWVLMEVTDTPRFNDINFVGVNNYPVPGKFCSYVYIPTGGKALNWLRQLLTAGKDPIPSYDEMTAEAENVPAGASGLFFIDRLAGTLFPTWQAESNAQFTGMNLEHGRGHLIRSVLEGVCFEYAVMLRALKAMGGAKNPDMIALGGASRSDLWMKIAASVYQKRLRVFTEPDLAPIGAAMIAAEGEGLISADSGQGDWCQLEVRLVEPDEKLVPVYEKLLDEYIALG